MPDVINIARGDFDYTIFDPAGSRKFVAATNVVTIFDSKIAITQISRDLLKTMNWPADQAKGNATFVAPPINPSYEITEFAFEFHVTEEEGQFVNIGTNF